MDLSIQFMPPTANAIYRVVKIRGHDQGSGFFVDVGRYQYFVTALHLVSLDEPKLKIFWNDTWQAFPCKVLNSNIDADIVILRPESTFCPTGLPLELSDKGIVYGQHVFFLGFPYGDHGKLPFENERPFPFIKWCAISMLPGLVGGQNVVLDGHNNPGFSGGPVCFNHSEGKQCIMGMVIGLKEETRFVDHFSREDSTGLVYKENAGLIYAASSVAILSLIAASEPGLSLD